jgi:xanthine dehydrogenase small subunit
LPSNGVVARWLGRELDRGLSIHREMRDHVTFLLNGTVERVSALSPTTTLLAHLRRVRRLTGTKEGCAEGDCGACTVVVGRLSNGRVQYRPINACIAFVPMLEGVSVTTVEHLKGPGGKLHPCQQAMVDCHGSQCGFCTPGFVMSLYALYAEGCKAGRGALNDALAGNLCRCTGYGPILAAGAAMFGYRAPPWEAERRAREVEALRTLQHSDTVALEHDGQRFYAPATLDELVRLTGQYPDATIVAGATDVGLWVTKQHRRLDTLLHIGRVEELQRIVEEAGRLSIGAGVTMADAEGVLGRHFPDLGELIRRFGARQVRSAATLGGNIANGSPIGDMAPALIVVGACLRLRKGAAVRVVPLEDFFIAYGKQDLTTSEIVESVEVPLRGEPERLKCYKVSKRFDQDISAVCGSFDIAVVDNRIVSARIAFGGMAATPKRARAVEAALVGQPWTAASVEAAEAAFAQDFAPISDMRGSAGYRLRIARNLLWRCFHETSGDIATRLVGRQSAFA